MFLYVETLYLFGLHFLFLFCHNAVFMLWLGSVCVVMVRETSWSGLRYLFWSPQTQLKMSPGLPTNMKNLLKMA